MDPARISLDNRWRMLEQPDAFLDNQTGDIDMLEQELRSLPRDEKTLICLHSNTLLVAGGSKTAEKLRGLLTSFADRATVLLAIGLPDNTTLPPENAVEYLASHVFYGKDGLHFGMLGPLILTQDTSPESVEVYIKAHERTSAPLLVHVTDFIKYEEFRPKLRSVKTIVFRGYTSHRMHLSSEPLHLMGVCTRNTCRSEVESLMRIASSDVGTAVTFSPGCRYKTDFKKYGGRGFTSRSYTEPESLRIAEFIAFPWSAPAAPSKPIDEAEMWVCDVCGVSARMDEKENYTKLGYTYCSIPCLASHRKRGFAPL
jgi:hypothetical protein